MFPFQFYDVLEAIGCIIYFTGEQVAQNIELCKIKIHKHLALVRYPSR